jgi:hypothetical protein
MGEKATTSSGYGGLTMSKLKLIAQVLHIELKNPDLTEEKRRELIENSLREYAIDTLNQYSFLRDRNIEDNTLKDFVQLEGLDFNLKTRKFF